MTGGFLDLGAGEAEGSGLDGFEGGDAGVAEAFDGAQVGHGGGDDGGEAAEAGEEVAGDGFGVAAGQRDEEHHFEEFVVGERVGAGGEQAGAHAGAVALGGGGGAGGCVGGEVDEAGLFGEAGGFFGHAGVWHAVLGPAIRNRRREIGRGLRAMPR